VISVFNALALEQRWVAWRNEERGDKFTKVPYSAPDKPAKANDPSTWLTRHHATNVARSIANGHGGGVGYQLGDHGADLFLAGCDLDSCLAAASSLAPWAEPILAALDTYAERSPSGTGIKGFFWLANEDVRPFLELLGVSDPEKWGTSRSIPGERPKTDHGPGVELYCALRYFAVTDQLWPGKPARLARLDWQALQHLARVIPPANENGAAGNGRDNSRSGAAWRKGIALRRAGKSFEEMVDALANDPETAEWVREKGMAHGMRELRRIWDRAAPNSSAGHNGVTLDDFYAYMPMHNYIFVLTRTTWPGASVNSRIPPIKLTDHNGAPVLNKDGKQVVLSAAAWLDRFKPVEQMIWAPGLPMIVSDKLLIDGGFVDRFGVTSFNLYQLPTIIPGDAKRADRWLEHIYYVFPDDADHILNWLAHRVQRPEEKINHALVLGGNQGIGKDTLLEPVKPAVGPWNFKEVSPPQILGRFNGFLKSVVLRVSEARDLGDFDRFQLYDHMKAYTAAPPDVLRVDEKNLREYYITNVCGVVITTNHKTDGIFLPADDRRHYVTWSEKTKEDPKFQGNYWNNLWGYYADGGINHIAAFLLEHDISRFDAKAPPPKTPAFWAIVDANRAPEEAEFADVFEHLGYPDVVTITMIQSAATGSFADWIGDRKNRRVFPHRLEKCGYVPVRNPDADSGLWVSRGRRQVFYAKNALSLRDQISAVRMIL
jgi:hypothetical protein